MMKIIYLFLILAVTGSLYAAGEALSPSTEMAFTLKDILFACSGVLGLGITWATVNNSIKDARRVADEAGQKASAIHERIDEFEETVTNMRLDVAKLMGVVNSFADSRFNQILQAQWSLHEALGKAGILERRGPS